MRDWTIYGEINNGRDGFPNIVAELSWGVHYSGGYGGVKSYEDLIKVFCRKRNAHTRNIKFVGTEKNLNGQKYRVYEVEISPNGKREFATRLFKAYCKNTK